ncbi:SRPBCC domain-containing protein [Nocardia stercoris]|uniref:Polyketide cyclase n=1 Tax=Nocardia stercoris TaxID=2483361 RepID=A0A3M2L464_9NOCA|nr:SRPBCC domain-containing protein [Nocardia stercoris]RMI30655.1 polyketide cyclase [Nocardia stercoris]
MEYGRIERELWIDAAPEVVFDVVSNPEHITHWWPDEADYEPTPGGTGEVVFHHEGQRITETFEVVDAEPYRMFSFRWTQPKGEPARQDNSYLVVFELTPEGTGTRLRMTEDGFRERGWEAAVLEAAYLDHSTGWDYHLARLAPYIASYVGAS